MKRGKRFGLSAEQKSDVWRRRSAFDAKQALERVENPELKKIIEANYRKMSR